MVKLHLGNGSVYLTNGWVNIDVWESGSCLASREPDRVQRWGTTEDRYYEKVQVDPENPLNPENFVCDQYGSWEAIPYPFESVKEILSRQAFEHLSKREAHWGLLEAWRVLEPGGVLRLDVPDHEETLKKWAGATSSEAQFLLRHLLGSRKDDYAYHMGSWTREKLIAFCGKRGFALEKEEPNIHPYPAFCLRFTKVPLLEAISHEFSVRLWDAPWQYCGEQGLGTPLSVPSHYKCLEIGPGDDKRRWPRANCYLDKEKSVLDSLETHTEKVVGDICCLPFTDKQFDYILCSHCIEHCTDPEQACKEMSRVAGEGIIITPSISKEALYCFHEEDHKWMIHQFKDCLYFFEIDQRWRDRLADRDAQAVMHKLLRLGAPQFGSDGARMRRWFRRAEPSLDNIHRWKDSPRIVVNR